MVSSEVQRTLVKSPPELWAELGDPAALARHLGELGEIRIVKTKPEERVEWEADGAAGTVLIKASGWGTKVTLSASRELDVSMPEPTHAEPESAPEPTELAAATEIEPAVEPEPEPTPAEEAPLSDPDDHATAPKSRRGFFARLFGRRKPATPELSDPADEASTRSSDVASPPADEPAAASPPPTPTPSAIDSLQERFKPEAIETAPEPTTTTPTAEPAVNPGGEQAEPRTDLAEELRQVEELAAEEVTAVLTAVLDRLGAAHHRPFSRS